MKHLTLTLILALSCSTALAQRSAIQTAALETAAFQLHSIMAVGYGKCAAQDMVDALQGKAMSGTLSRAERDLIMDMKRTMDELVTPTQLESMQRVHASALTTCW